jgi:hypothetical protein
MLIYYVQNYSDKWRRWTDCTIAYATEEDAMAVMHMYRREGPGYEKYRVDAVEANFDGPLRGPMAKHPE